MTGGAVDSFKQLQSNRAQLQEDRLRVQQESFRLARLDTEQTGYDRMIADDNARRASHSQIIAGPGDRIGVGSRSIARNRTSGSASNGDVLAANFAQTQADALDNARIGLTHQTRDAAQVSANRLGATSTDIRRRKRDAKLLLDFAQNAEQQGDGQNKRPKNRQSRRQRHNEYS